MNSLDRKAKLKPRAGAFALGTLGIDIKAEAQDFYGEA